MTKDQCTSELKMKGGFHMTKELAENNYMEALLRAALLLGDPHHSVPVHEIVISGFMIHDCIRELYPRCKIQVQMEQGSLTDSISPPTALGENYLILYPI